MALVVSLGVAGFAAAQEPPSVLTLGAALAAAQARSAALPAQDAAERAAREMAVAAARPPDPNLRLSLDNLPIEGPTRYSLTDDSMTQRSIEWSQTYVAPEKRQARSARYEREAEAALGLRQVQQARLATQTARAWLERHFQEQVRDLLAQQREEAQHSADAALAAYRGGSTTQAEVLAAHAALAQIDDRRSQASAELASAQALLQRWVGEAAALPLGPVPVLDSIRLSLHALGHEGGKLPDVAALQARERVAQAQAEVVRQERGADWSWSLMYSQRGRQFGDMVSLGLSIPLPWDRARRQDRELAAQLAQVEQIRLEREEVQREHLFDIARLFAHWQSQRKRLVDYDQTLIPLALARVEALEAALRSGKAGLTAVLEARRMVTDTRLERLRIEKDAAANWAELEFRIPSSPLSQEP